MRILIVGGGIGGLTLAQGLLRRGRDVTVLERDHDVLATGGYRLHLDDLACRVLRRELPPALWERLVAASAGGEAFEAMHVVDRRLRLLARVPSGAGEHRLVGRRELRQVLSEGLGERLVLGRRVSGYAVGALGEVRVDHDHGSRTTDLVVAADGVGSVVARQAAGRTTSRPLDLAGLAGRVSGLDPWDAGAPPYLRRGPALAIGPRGVGAFLTRHDVATELEPPGWVWGLILARPAHADQRTDPATALELLDGWAPWLRELVAATPDDTLGHYRFHVADPRAPMLPWPTGPVTALGDAVHAMPPTGGQSASTAIADAGDLLAAIDDVAAGRAGLAEALARYGATVTARARPRVRESLAPARWVVRSRSPLASAVVTAGTGALAGVRQVATRWAR